MVFSVIITEKHFGFDDCKKHDAKRAPFQGGRRGAVVRRGPAITNERSLIIRLRSPRLAQGARSLDPIKRRFCQSSEGFLFFLYDAIVM